MSNWADKIPFLADFLPEQHADAYCGVCAPLGMPFHVGIGVRLFDQHPTWCNPLALGRRFA